MTETTTRARGAILDAIARGDGTDVGSEVFTIAAPDGPHASMLLAHGYADVTAEVRELIAEGLIVAPRNSRFEKPARLTAAARAALAAPLICQWFALCDHPATGTISHPILGDVPICDRCSAKVEALS